MTDSIKLPAKCRECATSKSSRFHGNCHICRELEFQESVLCDLNRCVQDTTDFQCHAFAPTLKLVGLPQDKIASRAERPPKSRKKKTYLRLLDSDRIKYERALALQRLGHDPDGAYVQLKYHLFWNVSLRRSIFSPANDFIDVLNGTFLRCSELIGGYVALGYLAADHVHLYVESDGELSVETMVHKIKGVSNKAIIDEFPFVRDKVSGGTGFWDEAYFVETVS